MKEDLINTEEINAVEREIKTPEQERTNVEEIRVLETDTEPPIGEEEEKIEEVAARAKYGWKTVQTGKADQKVMEGSPRRKHLDFPEHGCGLLEEDGTTRRPFLGRFQGNVWKCIPNS